MQRERPVALVTGASRGIGASIARALGPSHELLLLARDRQLLRSLADALPAAKAVSFELTNLAAMNSALSDVDRLDVLIHSAGTWEPGLIGETEPEVWRRTFEVNLFAVAELTRLLLPALRARRGRVILINSTATKHAGAGRGAYAASKSALWSFAEALHAEEARHGVRVTTIYLGRVATDMQRRVREAEDAPFAAEDYLSSESVADIVRDTVMSPPSVHVRELIMQPTLK